MARTKKKVAEQSQSRHGKHHKASQSASSSSTQSHQHHQLQDARSHSSPSNVKISNAKLQHEIDIANIQYQIEQESTFQQHYQSHRSSKFRVKKRGKCHSSLMSISIENKDVINSQQRKINTKNRTKTKAKAKTKTSPIDSKKSSKSSKTSKMITITSTKSTNKRKENEARNITTTKTIKTTKTTTKTTLTTIDVKKHSNSNSNCNSNSNSFSNANVNVNVKKSNDLAKLKSKSETKSKSSINNSISGTSSILSPSLSLSLSSSLSPSLQQRLNTTSINRNMNGKNGKNVKMRRKIDPTLLNEHPDDVHEAMIDVLQAGKLSHKRILEMATSFGFAKQLKCRLESVRGHDTTISSNDDDDDEEEDFDCESIDIGGSDSNSSNSRKLV